ncbi:hypothetical protein [Legionella hackeliae]|uniref:Secreted protein n=1 Tax=Legionella hackeliae TaxID=449 RepID=A0A0A8US01_LEGHA|nr:hypothetical protein [Legionella hackeliae]KTD14835.1 hypothetical protein Lhac_0365 [Legionella hackeliae]CEK09539.1 exported protein of unknown function [Legionella hackeliae]STX49446.1 Uncharacterised protein [Legionella hackeliae]
MTKFIPLFLLLVSQLSFAETCETKRELIIENNETKVWKTTICPQQQLPFHTHDFARIVIPEEAGSLKVTYASGRETVINFEKQIPVFLSKAQGQESHQDLNTGTLPLHVTVIELRNKN